MNMIANDGTDMTGVVPGQTPEGVSEAGVTQRSSRRGFSLIELIISIALLSIGAISIYHAIFSYLELSEMANDRNIAFFDLETALEDIRSTPFDRIVDTYPDGSTITKFDALHLKNESVVVRYRNPNRDPLVITATISWEDSKGRARSESMHTARTR